MACGAWVAGSALDFKAGLFGAVFGAEGAEVRLPGAPAGSSTTCTTGTAPVAFSFPCRGSALGVVFLAVSLAAFVVPVACCDREGCRERLPE